VFIEVNKTVYIAIKNQYGVIYKGKLKNLAGGVLIRITEKLYLTKTTNFMKNDMDWEVAIGDLRSDDREKIRAFDLELKGEDYVLNANKIDEDYTKSDF